MSNYFAEKLSMYNTFENKAKISNKYSGSCITVSKIVIEDIIECTRQGLSVEEICEIRSEYVDYYKKVFKALDKMSLITPYKYYERDINFIPLISFSITKKCNLECSYCCTSSDINNNSLKELNTREIKECINNILKYNPLEIKISGGEPLVRKDALEILEYLRSKYKNVIIFATNATLLSRKKIDILSKYVDSVEISLDGYNNETYNDVRQNSDATFENIVDYIKIFQENGIIDIYASMVVGVNNCKNVEKFIDMCELYNVKPIIRAFTKVGSGLLDDTYLRDERDYIYDFYGIEKFIDYKLRATTCNAGDTQIYIDSLGDVYPCPLLVCEEYRIGNILKDDLYKKRIDVIENLNKKRAIFRKGCKDCQYAIYCGNCHYVSMHETQKNVFEYHCSKNKKYFKKCSIK
ncbi:radical SAM/SPASM domain-containing protein [Peptostreptococcus sp. D1]|uniref:radical SAM/SPASM domain-containing protein n=1 Tax=Peptostreptococcus sp. D1 TaxID=72304 RepID=UPI0008ED7C0E|nr:radical SAM protein [Peptostreptococcus sp. D1]SFE91180.1 radical SAM additional 4Fe4S-binding SPASM domain-containing protein [Peptostreptococcus sp. D1]